MDLTHDTIHRRGDGGFHLHRFGDDDGVALLDRGAFFDEEFYHGAGECRTDFARYVLVRFSGGIRRLCHMSVVDLDLARHAVQLELKLSVAFQVRFCDIIKANEEHLAFIDVDADFFTDFHAEEIGRRIKEREVAILMIAVHVVGEDFRIDAVGGDIFFAGRDVLLFHFHLDFFKVDILRLAFEVRLLSAQDDLLEFFREAAIRDAELAVEEVDNGLREVEGISLFIDILLGQMVLYHEEGHIADDLGGRGDLDDIAEHHIDLRIHAADFRPLGSETDSRCLLAQVRVLSARHFMLVKGRIRIRHLGVDTCIVRTDTLPVAVDGLKRIDIQLRLARVILQCVVHGGHGRLAGTARECAGRNV